MPVTIDKARLVKITNVKIGDWLIFTKPHLNCHIVDINIDGNGIYLYCNYGEGYAGTTKIYDRNDYVYIA